MRSPRNARHAEKPGSYRIATRIDQPNLNPGGTLRFEQYITGYGFMSTAKIQAYISSDVIEFSESHVIHSLKATNTPQGQELSWGNETEPLTSPGYTCHLAGVSAGEGHESSIAFDRNDSGGNPGLVCEQHLKHAPFEFTLKTKSNIKPGEYYMDFYLTFYNGERWTTSNERVNFKVKNFFERNSKIISSIALAASLLGVFRFSIQPLFEIIKPLIVSGM